MPESYNGIKERVSLAAEKIVTATKSDILNQLCICSLLWLCLLDTNEIIETVFMRHNSIASNIYNPKCR
jgi:hypothetical protein